MTAWVISRIRTFVPVAAGAGIVWLEELAGTDLINDEQATAWVVAFVIGAYYELVRRAERRWPKAGWLLGYPSEPTY